MQEAKQLKEAAKKAGKKHKASQGPACLLQIHVLRQSSSAEFVGRMRQTGWRQRWTSDSRPSSLSAAWQSLGWLLSSLRRLWMQTRRRRQARRRQARYSRACLQLLQTVLRGYSTLLAAGRHKSQKEARQGCSSCQRARAAHRGRERSHGGERQGRRAAAAQPAAGPPGLVYTRYCGALIGLAGLSATQVAGVCKCLEMSSMHMLGQLLHVPEAAGL